MDKEISEKMIKLPEEAVKTFRQGKREERRLAMAQVITPVKEAYQMAANLFNARVEELEREGLKLYLTRA